MMMVLSCASLLGAGCEAAASAADDPPPDEPPGLAAPVSAAFVTPEELRLYGRGGVGLYRTNRHADGSWDAITQPVLFLSGSIVQAAGVGPVGYVFTFDGRAGGALLEESTDGQFHIIPLPRPPVIGGPPFLVGADVTSVGGVLNVCATSLQGRLLHATPEADGTFATWTDIEAQAGALASTSTLSCTRSGGRLHACAVDAAGEVRHTILFRDGTWQPWGLVEGSAGDIGTATRVRCRGLQDRLFVLAHSDRGAFLAERRGNGSWRAWQHLGSSIGDAHADDLTEIAVVAGEVHAVGSDEDGIWHTIRHANRRWDPLGNVQGAVSGYPPEARTVMVATISQ